MRYDMWVQRESKIGAEDAQLMLDKTYFVVVSEVSADTVVKVRGIWSGLSESIIQRDGVTVGVGRSSSTEEFYPLSSEFLSKKTAILDGLMILRK